MSDHRRNPRIPLRLFSKPQHPSRRVPPNACLHHAGWEAKISFLFSFDAYPIRCSPIVSGIRTARQIRPDPTHQIHNHTCILFVHVGVPRGMESVAGAERYLDHPLSAPAQLVNWRLGGWSSTLINLAQVVSKRCVRVLLQSIPIDPGRAVPVIHATSPSATIRNAMAQYPKILTAALVCYTSSAVAFAFFHVISSPQTPSDRFRFFVKSKFVLPAFRVMNALTS